MAEYNNDRGAPGFPVQADVSSPHLRVNQSACTEENLAKLARSNNILLTASVYLSLFLIQEPDAIA